MFSDNQRISRRQLKRQLLLGLSGVFLLIMPQVSVLYGLSGLLGIFLGTVLLWIYLFFLVRSTAVARSLHERIGKKGYWVIAVFYLTYLLMSGGYMIRITSDMISYALLPDYRPWLIGVLLISAALIGTGGEIQRRGRLGEIAYLPVVGGLFLLVILAAFQIKTVEWSSFSQLDIMAVIESAYHVFCSFSIVGILPFLMNHVERPQSALKYLMTGTGLAAVLAAGGILVLQLLFGVNGSMQKKMPITSLMSAVNFPGGFVDRFDAVWMVFLLFALLYSAGTVFYYGQHLLEGQEKTWIRILLAGLVFAAAFWKWKDYDIFRIYPWCVRHLYVPVFVGFGLILSKIRRKM